MKNENVIKIESCASSADLVAYLYDELKATERASFETHLADCGTCTDEFAELSFARLNVYEWHRDEFAAMETPRFVMPYSTESDKAAGGWSQAWYGLFAGNRQWLTAGGALAAIAIIFGVIMIRPAMIEPADVVQSPKLDGSSFNAARPVDNPADPPQMAEKKTKSSPAGDTFDGVKIAKAATTVKDPAAAKRQVIKTPERGSTRPVRSQRTAAPRLNDFEDEDDNTLRLGDLLADVDTKD